MSVLKGNHSTFRPRHMYVLMYLVALERVTKDMRAPGCVLGECNNRIIRVISRIFQKILPVQVCVCVCVFACVRVLKPSEVFVSRVRNMYNC